MNLRKAKTIKETTDSYNKDWLKQWKIIWDVNIMNLRKLQKQKITKRFAIAQ